MSKYICKVCGYIYDGDFLALPDSWTCPMCHVSKDLFEPVKEVAREETVFIEVDKDNPSICRNENLCVKCGNCKSVCRFKQSVYGHYDIQKCKCKSVCVDCGQCCLACPTGALDIKMDYMELEKLMQDKTKVFVFQTSPSSRVALAEEFGQKEGTICTGKLVSALRKLGANYVFDTTFGADLTIMEEAKELVERLKNKQNLPLITSCCPAWVKFAEIFYPEKINLLSSCKSPISMQGAMIKTFWAKKMGIKKENIVSVAITPCTAKKAEIKRTKNVDFVIPIRELARWMKEREIRFDLLEESEYDSMMQTGSGGGIIFGVSGGVMESALRTANFMLTGKNLKNCKFENLRKNDGFTEAKVRVGNKTLSVAVVSGLVNAHKLFEQMKKGKKYDFVEVMACLGGCMAGGGQPKNLFNTFEDVRKMRKQAIYSLDESAKIKFAHENPEIVQLYETYLNKTGSELLHTTYADRSDILG